MLRKASHHKHIGQTYCVVCDWEGGGCPWIWSGLTCRCRSSCNTDVFKIFNTEEQSTWFDLSALQYRPSCMTWVMRLCDDQYVDRGSGPLTYIFSSVMEKRDARVLLNQGFNRYMLLSVTLCSCLWHPVSSRISIHCVVYVFMTCF